MTGIAAMTAQKIRKGSVELLGSAAHDIQLAVSLALQTGPPTEAELRDHGWQLAQLTGGLGDLAALLANEMSTFGDHRLLDDDRGGDAGRPLEAASGELEALRRALTAAEAAARDFYTAIGHVAVDVDLDAGRPPRQYQ